MHLARVNKQVLQRKLLNRERFNSEQGFTLLEVIIAIALIAVALPAFLFSMAQVSNATADTSRDSIASWIAHNQMATVKLEYELTDKLLKGEATGQVEMAGQRWDWRVITAESELPDMWRITAEAGLENSESPVQIIGFIRAQEESNQPGGGRN